MRYTSIHQLKVISILKKRAMSWKSIAKS